MFYPFFIFRNIPNQEIQSAKFDGSVLAINQTFKMDAMVVVQGIGSSCCSRKKMQKKKNTKNW